jgi:NAD(P)-dependent dehydrogenase (short-subunit alcohol dehydrogenase family)
LASLVNRSDQSSLASEFNEYRRIFAFGNLVPTMHERHGLNGKAGVVTGAAGGIGAAIARRLAEYGAAVACVDRNERVERVASEIVSDGGRAIAVQVDVGTDEGNHAAVAASVEAFGGIDAFFANAAIQLMGPLEESSRGDWEQMFDTNLYGVASGLRAALPELRKRGGGSLIITASLLGIVGDPDLPAYGAMKGALRALCRSLATAHGPDNIRVNTICPGDVDTPLLDQFFGYQEDPEGARRDITNRYPLRRLATPRDVANVAAFLCSDDAAYISGTDLIIDGGLLARIY